MPTALTFQLAADDVVVAPPRCDPVVMADLLRIVQHRCVWSRVPPLLVLDLTEVTDWDMSVLSTMVWARRRCIAARGDLALVLPRRAVFTANEVASLEQLFHVAADVDEARSALQADDSHRFASGVAQHG